MKYKKISADHKSIVDKKITPVKEFFISDLKKKLYN